MPLLYNHLIYSHCTDFHVYLPACITLKKLAALATESSGKKYTLDGLSRKMSTGTIRFDDVEYFAKLL